MLLSSLPEQNAPSLASNMAAAEGLVTHLTSCLGGMNPHHAHRHLSLRVIRDSSWPLLSSTYNFLGNGLHNCISSLSSLDFPKGEECL